jgi:hypothetical protein
MTYITQFTEDVAFAQRQKPYRNIHKALRASMMKTLLTVSQADPFEEAERLAAAAATEDLLDACASHLEHEMTFIHPVLRERKVEAVVAFDDDHGSQKGTMSRLRDLAAAVRKATPASARELLYQLYLELSAFIGHNLEHMAEEESVLTHAVWQRLTDEEILEIEGRIVASLPPQEAAWSVEWMARSLNRPELVEVLQGMKAAMPPQVFAGILGMVKGCVKPALAARLDRELGLAEAEPRLVA